MGDLRIVRWARIAIGTLLTFTFLGEPASASRWRPDTADSGLVELGILNQTIEVSAGDTLSGLLEQQGVVGSLRAEVALAISALFDLSRLRPGHQLELFWGDGPEHRLKRMVLVVDDGVRIEIELATSIQVTKVEPEVQTQNMQADLEIAGSLFDTFELAAIPLQFAVELSGILGGLVDFRSELQGGERVVLAWREDRDSEGILVGNPTLRYAQLNLVDRVLEIAAPDQAAQAALIYENGKLIRTFSPPVVGARLSSVFGRRKHPVYGNVRLHTGVDYAAAKGTPVSATSPGQVAFVGRIRGYGRVVDIDHGSGVTTRYAHLSKYSGGLRKGFRVQAGDIIGEVGSSGTATGPNLHFEMRINGRPIDPLKSGPGLVNNRPSQVELQRLAKLRKQYTTGADSRFQFASGTRK